MPVLMPDTTPDVRPIVATEVLVLVHVPPGSELYRVDVNPSHTVVLPVIADGSGCTVTAIVAKHPAGVVNLIVAMPAVIPVMIPVVAPAVAIVGLMLLHTPGVVASLSVIVLPTHTDGIPVIAAGNGYTVTVVTTKHPPVVV